MMRTQSAVIGLAVAALGLTSCVGLNGEQQESGPATSEETTTPESGSGEETGNGNTTDEEDQDPTLQPLTTDQAEELLLSEDEFPFDVEEVTEESESIESSLATEFGGGEGYDDLPPQERDCAEALAGLAELDDGQAESSLALSAVPAGATAESLLVGVTSYPDEADTAELWEEISGYCDGLEIEDDEDVYFSAIDYEGAYGLTWGSDSFGEDIEFTFASMDHGHNVFWFVSFNVPSYDVLDTIDAQQEKLEEGLDGDSAPATD